MPTVQVTTLACLVLLNSVSNAVHQVQTPVFMLLNYVSTLTVLALRVWPSAVLCKYMPTAMLLAQH